MIAPGAFIGYRAEIGRNTMIGSGATIGRGVKIGDDCRIGPNVTLTHALVGNRVIIHPGTSIGQDGFGFIPCAPDLRLKVPQLGTVEIQDDVEIGANVAIDRGALGATVIGSGSKLDNLVQIGHHAVIGEHCVIVGQVGISGSVTVGDWVTIGGQAGIGDHLLVGSGSQIAARSGVTKNLEGHETYAGFPAIKRRDWNKEQGILRKFAKSFKHNGSE